MKVTCENCGYFWKDPEDEYGRCHYDGELAPCAADEYYQYMQEEM